MTETEWIILGGAAMTYLARAGGHVVLSRFETIHPRVEVGLDAVPAAVLSTLITPALFHGGPAEIGAIVVAGVMALRFGLMTMFLSGAVALMALRYLLG